MPWTCPSCNASTELGYNTCLVCNTVRPGTEPPPKFDTPVHRPIPWQFSLGRLLGFATCIGCTIAYTINFGPDLLDIGNNGSFDPVRFSIGLVAGTGATIGTLARGHRGTISGLLIGSLLGYLIPVALALLFFLYLLATGQDIMPAPN